MGLIKPIRFLTPNNLHVNVTLGTDGGLKPGRRCSDSCNDGCEEYGTNIFVSCNGLYYGKDNATRIRLVGVCSQDTF